MRETRYRVMLSDDIHVFMNLSSCKTLEGMIVRPWEREIKLQLRPKTQDLRSRDYQGQGCCAKYGRPHEGSFHKKIRGCFSCGQTGIFRRD